jgi:hypothetical protein
MNLDPEMIGCIHNLIMKNAIVETVKEGGLTEEELESMLNNPEYAMDHENIEAALEQLATEKM